MAKLVLSTNGTVVHQCFLDKARVTIGREAGNQIVVDDKAVSRLHAAITAVGNDYILEDLGSFNGTAVNGTRVQRRILQHGDVVALGAHHLRYLDSKAASEIELERTMLISGLLPMAGATRAGEASAVDASATANLRVPAARPARVQLPRGHVVFLQGARRGETQELDRVVAIVGTPGVALAVITRRPRGYFVTHVEGRSSPRVNGQVIGIDARELREGDVVAVGTDTLQFWLR